ncbi:MAG: DUF2325 domain-containing protein [Deltaproteobacteria bacterium]|nr:DUF2325 domain-containing protein [Deltaproteobacteria bacterium]
MRLKIWETRDHQCSILGTCLSLGELRRIARKFKVTMPSDATDFQIHATFVSMCRMNCPASRDITKLLDRKYSKSLRTFGMNKSDTELRSLWREALRSGNIPGPYWAIASHPKASEEFQAEVFGEVHMLSHLVGSSNRADVRRLAALEERTSQLQERWNRVKAAHRHSFRLLVEENRKAKAQVASLTADLESYRRKFDLRTIEALRNENEELKDSLTELSSQLDHMRVNEARMARRTNSLVVRNDNLELELADKDAEVEFLEKEIHRLLSALANSGPCIQKCEKAGTEACPGPNLCGKRILYVGGRANLVRHYRALVERYGGKFEHHDGGLEESQATLPVILGGVDAVVCPVDCVSHGACLKVKEACRHKVKPLKLARSSGLSSLARILGELAANEELLDNSRLEEC